MKFYNYISDLKYGNNHLGWHIKEAAVYLAISEFVADTLRKLVSNLHVTINSVSRCCADSCNNDIVSTGMYTDHKTSLPIHILIQKFSILKNDA